jgi:hypothetical protein
MPTLPVLVVADDERVRDELMGLVGAAHPAVVGGDTPHGAGALRDAAGYSAVVIDEDVAWAALWALLFDGAEMLRPATAIVTTNPALAGAAAESGMTVVARPPARAQIEDFLRRCGYDGGTAAADVPRSPGP